MNQTMNLFYNKRVNRKKIRSVLTTTQRLDSEKQKVFETMKHDFFAHLSDRQCDIVDRQRCTISAIRKQFKGILSQIPSNLQNMTIEEIVEKGGSIDLIDDEYIVKTFAIRIPKTVANANKDLSSQLMSHNKSNESNALQRIAITKNTVTKKANTAAKENTTTTSSRIITRSALKGCNVREVMTTSGRDRMTHNSNIKNNLKANNNNNKTKSDSKMTDKIMSSLPHMKPPRRPQSNEEMITLCFSSAGTPLIVDQKTIERINTTTTTK